jgi:putative transposase
MERAIVAEKPAASARTAPRPALAPAAAGERQHDVRYIAARRAQTAEFAQADARARNDGGGPQIAPMHLTRWPGFDDRILSLHARGLGVREIRMHLHEIYGTDVPPNLIASVTDAVGEESKAWRTRRLDATYAIVYLDSLQAKVCDTLVRAQSAYVAIGVTLDGEKQMLGLWLARSDSDVPREIMTDLGMRGVRDILIACVDTPDRFRSAIAASFPRTEVQACIAHRVRQSLDYVSWKRRARLAADLKRICSSASAAEAERHLAHFEATWDAELRPIVRSWRRDWAHVVSFYAFAPEIRKVLCAGNAFETINRSLRRLTKQVGTFSSDEALAELLYLLLRSIGRKWTMPIREWKVALSGFSTHFGDRLPPP